MSLALLNTMLLRVLSDPDLTAKGSVLTWEEVDQRIVILCNAIKELAEVEISGLDPFDAGEEYSNTDPDYVTYGGNTWEYVNAVPSTGVTPGTDPATWALASQGIFSHSQNTDQYLDFGGINESTALEIRTLLDAFVAITAGEGISVSAGVVALGNISITNHVVDYTLILTDKNQLKEIDKVTAVTATVPPNSSVAFPIGSQIYIYQKGVGQVTISPGSGVTINAAIDASPPIIKLRAQYSSAALIKTATNTWLCVGDLEV